MCFPKYTQQPSFTIGQQSQEGQGAPHLAPSGHSVDPCLTNERMGSWQRIQDSHRMSKTSNYLNLELW